jgi:hypothetical protein
VRISLIHSRVVQKYDGLENIEDRMNLGPSDIVRYVTFWYHIWNLREISVKGFIHRYSTGTRVTPVSSTAVLVGT